MDDPRLGVLEDAPAAAFEEGGLLDELGTGEVVLRTEAMVDDELIGTSALLVVGITDGGAADEIRNEE